MQLISMQILYLNQLVYVYITDNHSSMCTFINNSDDHYIKILVDMEMKMLKKQMQKKLVANRKREMI